MATEPKTFFMNEQHELPRDQRTFKKVVLIQELRIVRETNRKLRAEIDDLHKTRDAATFSERKRIDELQRLRHRCEVVLRLLLASLSYKAANVQTSHEEAKTDLILEMVTFLVQDLKGAS
jgi:hypothetical protein